MSINNDRHNSVIVKHTINFYFGNRENRFIFSDINETPNTFVLYTRVLLDLNSNLPQNELFISVKNNK